MKKTNKQTKRHMYRQGDVLLIPVDKLDIKGMVRTKHLTLALGEVTGHHHSIYSTNGAVGYAPTETDLVQFLDVVEDQVTLTHPEHGAIDLPNGKYEVFIQSDYTPEEVRQVAD